MYLQHFGVEGMRWGIRRYQNYDGTLTEVGRAHYLVGKGKYAKKLQRTQDRYGTRIQKREEKGLDTDKLKEKLAKKESYFDYLATAEEIKRAYTFGEKWFNWQHLGFFANTSLASLIAAGYTETGARKFTKRKGTLRGIAEGKATAKDAIHDQWYNKNKE